MDGLWGRQVFVAMYGISSIFVVPKRVGRAQDCLVCFFTFSDGNVCEKSTLFSIFTAGRKLLWEKYFIILLNFDLQNYYKSR